VDVPEVNTLALMLAQSERLGTDAASTLMEFANSLRVNLRQRAEATANRTSFWMLLPTVFLLLPAAALLIMAAPFFEFTRQRTEAMQKLTGAKGEIEKIVPGVTESAPAAEEPQPEIP
jgi:type II secretory pathway component PulM